MSLEVKLTSIRVNKSRKINDVDVKRDSEEIYNIDGTEYSLDGAVEYLSSKKSHNPGEIAYSKTAFLLVEPPSRVISAHQAKNRQDHKALIAKANVKGLYLYYADVKCRDGKYYAVKPWIVDWETVPEHPEEIAKREAQQEKKKAKEATKEVPETPEQDSLTCPYCSKRMSSTSGLTLHIKSKHPDKLNKHQTSTMPDEDDVVSRASEVEEVGQSQSLDSLQCPFCDKKMTSTPGRTLHIKSKHPERLAEYLEMDRD